MDFSPAITGTITLAKFGIELAQAPAEVRRCVELTNTVNKSLLDLTQLRNEHKALLDPDKLRRTDETIKEARNTILEMCKIVEKSKPKALGNMGLFGRLRWRLVDLAEFHALLPVLERHHGTVMHACTQLTVIVEARHARYMVEREKRIEERTRLARAASVEFFHLELIGAASSSTDLGGETLGARKMIEAPPGAPARPPLFRADEDGAFDFCPKPPVRRDTRGGPRFRPESESPSTISSSSSFSISSLDSSDERPSSRAVMANRHLHPPRRAAVMPSVDESADLVGLFTDLLTPPPSTGLEMPPVELPNGRQRRQPAVTRVPESISSPPSPPLTPRLGPASAAADPYFYGPRVVPSRY